VRFALGEADPILGSRLRLTDLAGADEFTIGFTASAEARARIPALKAGREFEVEIVRASPQPARREAS